MAVPGEMTVRDAVEILVAEGDPVPRTWLKGALAHDLIQVAAVAVAIVQDLKDGIADANSDSLGVILDEVARERKRQDIQHGSQHHMAIEWVSILSEELGKAAEMANWFHFGDHDSGRKEGDE